MILEANLVILTIREIRAIDLYVRCQESYESEALRMLKLNRFNSKPIHGVRKGNHYY
ncbi:hypothetical protein [Bacillus sp. Ba 3]|uniref:hypothetical protein n=1 Tax=Bacillus sp. Ba 3 TaxID=3397768 RepID=UPI0039E00A13